MKLRYLCLMVVVSCICGGILGYLYGDVVPEFAAKLLGFMVFGLILGTIIISLFSKRSVESERKF